MSRLPHTIRAEFAARLIDESLSKACECAEMSAGFDAGEFSGPATWGDFDKERRAILRRFSVTDYQAQSSSLWTASMYGDDPMGCYMGRNE